MSTTERSMYRSSSGSPDESWNSASKGNSDHSENIPPGASLPAKRRSGHTWWIMLVLLLLAVSTAAALYLGLDTNVRRNLNNGLITNNSYINGLYTNWNTIQTDKVFQYVFRNLDDEVTIYPSENYYYFNLSLRGKMLSGSFHLDVRTRDSGVIEFGFVEKFQDRTAAVGQYRPGWNRLFGPDEGVQVSKVNDYRYKATFEGKTVTFNLYNGDTARPVKARLMSDEEYVGPSFDESGLRFFLLFNKTINRLYWVLNEDGYVAEDFTRVNDHLTMGDRTEFIFYKDSVNNRKILVGVHGLNVGHNNWFDGPFDQLPDNLVKAGKVELRKYLEAHFRYQPGGLDIYGNFTGKGEGRAGVCPYTTYFEPADLVPIDSCIAAGLTGAQLYGAITRERYDIMAAVDKGYLKPR